MPDERCCLINECIMSRLSELRKDDNEKLVVNIIFPMFLAQHVGKQMDGEEGDILLLSFYRPISVINV